jgi:predicted Zn-dependent protease
MTIHAQIGLAVAGGVPVAAGKVKTLEQVYEKAKRLSAEPRDLQVLLGLAKYKYGSDDKAIEIFKKIAANKPEFFKGHSQLAELSAAEQADVCLTCYAYHCDLLRVTQGISI